MTEQLKMKYSILPSRIVNEKRFKLSHYNVMVALGVSAGKSGLLYLTIESIENRCPHVKRETIKKTMADLVKWGYLYKLESKYIKNQKSKWLTNRYMMVYTPDQPLPKYEELQKEVMNVNRVDDTIKEDMAVEESKIPEHECVASLRICSEAVNLGSGIKPQFTLTEYIQVMGDNKLDLTKDSIIEFTRQFIKHYRRNPSLKEVLYSARIG